MSIFSSVLARSGPTPFRTVTGSSARSARPLVIRGGGRSFDAEEVGVERLATVVHLAGGRGSVLVQPLGDVARRAGRRAFALDDRDDLVAREHQLRQQLGGGIGELALHG